MYIYSNKLYNIYSAAYNIAISTHICLICLVVISTLFVLSMLFDLLGAALVLTNITYDDVCVV